MTAAVDEPFDEYYAREIAPALSKLEGARRSAARWHHVILGVALVAAVAIVAPMIVSREASPPLLILAGVVVVLGAVIAHVVLGVTAASVKDELLPRVAAYAGVSYTRHVHTPASIRDFREHRLIPSYDQSSFEDLVAGEAADCPFELYEAHLKQRQRDSKGRTHHVTCFRGQLLRVLAPQEFLGRTIILRDVGIFNAFLKPGDGMKRVGLVDPKFERVFEVFADDQVEARCLLTPDFMERLLTLERMLHGQKARAAFADGELLIAIEGGDLFEPGSMFTPLADPRRARQVLEEIELVGKIIEALLAAEARRPRATA